MQQQKILVTGANGQLGRSLQDIQAQFAGYTIIWASKADLDITDKQAVTTFFNTHNFAYCIHAAAYTNVEQAEGHPELAISINAQAVQYIADLCKTHDVVLLHISTDYVFDGKKKTPYLPTDKTNPINVYGKSKAMAEQYIITTLARYFIIRTSWLYSDYGHNFYKTILKKSKTEKTLYITDSQVGTPTHAGVLAVYLSKIIQKKSKNYGIHHCSGDRAMSWYGFAQKIKKDQHLDVQLIARDYPSKAKRPAYSVLQNTTID